MPNKNFVLIGFMGVGKTSVGKLLAQKISCDFVDVDELIQYKYNMSIQQIFLEFGEDYFRKLETEVIEEVSKLENTVIATGGGATINPSNIENLKREGFIILLNATPKFIFNNIINESHRPLLAKDNLFEQIETLLTKRKDSYNCYDVQVNVDGLTIEQVTNKVFDILKGNSNI